MKTKKFVFGILAVCIVVMFISNISAEETTNEDTIKDVTTKGRLSDLPPRDGSEIDTDKESSSETPPENLVGEDCDQDQPHIVTIGEGNSENEENMDKSRDTSSNQVENSGLHIALSLGLISIVGISAVIYKKIRK
ncbi:MAG: hypothetical protein V5A68_04505 [Candidatus Thermoplasmatota archaeon]